MTFHVRPAKAGDETLILTLLMELAVYEKLTDRFQITEAVIARDYLCAQPLLECDLAFEGDRPVGIATWYWSYASFAARRGIYLEDLFVRPEFRGRGYGKRLLAGLAKRAMQAGGGHVDWAVLDWNKPSIDFYDGIGAKANRGWTGYRLSGAALEDMANE
ncbi:MAG TPA: GNAT family N-acetyltransferase [Rhizomicrobium sp.]|jgi:GNAT superfamily N-acetyltransferase|nr:GNAT family N-acetyltransferase [Rhizomicrobium sp.]